MKWSSHLSWREAKLKTGSEWRHEQSGWCLVRVAEGQGYWLTGTAPRELGVADVFVIPPGDQGYFRASLIAAVKLEFFLWRGEILQGLLSPSERKFFSLPPSAAVRCFSSASEVARHFAELGLGKNEKHDFRFRAQLLQLVASVFGEDLSRHLSAADFSADAAERFEKVIHHITDRELLRYTPAQLARLCGCSSRHFSRLFQEHFGVSARARQTRLRLQQAGQLLADTDAKILSIARECGYRNLGIFNSLFKKHLGMTPTQWRSQQRTQEASAPNIPCLPCHAQKPVSLVSEVPQAS